MDDRDRQARVSAWQAIARRARSIKVRKLVKASRPRFCPDRLRVVSISR